MLCDPRRTPAAWSADLATAVKPHRWSLARSEWRSRTASSHRHDCSRDHCSHSPPGLQRADQDYGPDALDGARSVTPRTTTARWRHSGPECKPSCLTVAKWRTRLELDNAIFEYVEVPQPQAPPPQLWDVHIHRYETLHYRPIDSRLTHTCAVH